MKTKKLIFVVEIAGQFILLNELQYEKYLIFNKLKRYKK